MDTFISTTKLILILTTVLLVVDAQDVVCKKGKTKKKVMIGEGDSFSFRTQAGAKYAPNTKCVVTYKRKKATCPMIMFTCSQFKINNKDSSCNKKDKMIVQEGRKKKSYCKTSAPDITTSANNLKVSFFSDNNRQASGAVCTAQCTTGHTTTTTVEPDTSTTESTTTGTCIEEGVDFLGSDVGYTVESSWTEGSLQCACSCRKSEECKFFSYHYGMRLCMLKATEGTRRSHSYASSGSEQCCEDDLLTETPTSTFQKLETCKDGCCWKGPSRVIEKSEGPADGTSGQTEPGPPGVHQPEHHDSVEACAKRCEDLEDCQAFHYYDPLCFLYKGGVIGPHLDDGIIRLSGECPKN